MTNRAFMTISMPKTATRQTVLAARRHRGASMIEVLVSILLVSVGLLGIAGLSGATFNYNKVSQMRLTGIALANDLADRARVNVYGYDRGGYDIDLSDNFGGTAVTVPDSNLDLDPSMPANADTAADGLAASDVDQFLRSVRNRLPQGDAIVMGAGATTSRASATSRDLDVWLLWKEPQTDAVDSLFTAGQSNCPSSLTPAERAEYSCMYFKVGL
jgi:type IV pilus assembly protein PilV